MVNLIKNIKILTFLSILLTGCSSITTIHDYYANEEMNLSDKQKIRLNNYLSGEFYSYDIEKKVFAYPMVFFISSNGEKSLILACRGVLDECNSSIHIYPLMLKYKKKTNMDFKILALGKKIVVKKINQKTNKKNIRYIKINNSHKNIFYDFIVLPSDNCSSDDC